MKRTPCEIYTREEWREIPRLPQWKYFVSNLGRIKNRKWKIMKYESNHYWHQRIKLYGNNKHDCKHYQVHRAVYCVFNWLDYEHWLHEDISKCTSLVLHKDNNPFNNRLDNLYMWTQKDNMKQCSKEWRIVVPALKWEYNPLAKLKESDIPKIIELINSGICQNKIAEMFWVSCSAINNIWKWRSRKFTS